MKTTRMRFTLKKVLSVALAILMLVSIIPMTYSVAADINPDDYSIVSASPLFKGFTPAKGLTVAECEQIILSKPLQFTKYERDGVSDYKHIAVFFLAEADPAAAAYGKCTYEMDIIKVDNMTDAEITAALEKSGDKVFLVRNGIVYRYPVILDSEATMEAAMEENPELRQEYQAMGLNSFDDMLTVWLYNKEEPFHDDLDCYVLGEYNDDNAIHFKSAPMPYSEGAAPTKDAFVPADGSKFTVKSISYLSGYTAIDPATGEAVDVLTEVDTLIKGVTYQSVMVLSVNDGCSVKPTIQICADESADENDKIYYHLFGDVEIPGVGYAVEYPYLEGTMTEEEWEQYNYDVIVREESIAEYACTVGEFRKIWWPDMTDGNIIDDSVCLEGVTTNDCDENDIVILQTFHIHEYTRHDTDKWYKASDATCAKRATYYCSCEHCYGYSKDVTFEAGELSENHTEPNAEGKCDICGKQLTSPSSDTEEKPTLMKRIKIFFNKIIDMFRRLFSAK